MGALAFIIFGRKVREKDYGPAYPGYCHRCDNDAYMHAFKWRSWGHLFWIPLLPWSSHKLLICPICSQQIELDRSAFKRAKELASIVERLEAGDAEEDEFAAALKDFEATAGLEPVDESPPDEIDDGPDNVPAEPTELDEAESEKSV